jgi:hypothetical protein
MRRRLAGFGVSNGGHGDPLKCRNFGTAIRPAPAPCDEVLCIRPGPILFWAASVVAASWTSSVFKVGARQEIGADHLQAISSRFVSAKHQRNRFQGLLDHGQLALVNLEIENLPGLRFFAGQMSFDLSFKPLLR